MLKCNVNNGKCTLLVMGDLKEICTNLTTVILGIANDLKEKDDQSALMFKMMFTKGFMEGVCFDEDRETMEKYLKDMDEMAEAESESDKKKKGTTIDILKELRDLLSDMTDEEIKALEQHLPELEERLRKGDKK